MTLGCPGKDPAVRRRRDTALIYGSREIEDRYVSFNPQLPDAADKALARAPVTTALCASWYGYDVEPPDNPPCLWPTISGSCAATAGRFFLCVRGVCDATLIVSARLTPIYESTVTVDIDRQMPSSHHRPGGAARAAERCGPVSGDPDQADPVGFGSAAGGANSIICSIWRRKLRRYSAEAPRQPRRTLPCC